jgi:hypothetical protein
VGRVLRLRGGENAEQDEQNEGSGRANAAGALDGNQMETFDTVMKHRFFFRSSFYIHGGVSDLFDYGRQAVPSRRASSLTDSHR